MRTSSLLFAAVAIAIAVAAIFAAAAAADTVGSWQTVDVNDPHVQELGRWAVAATGLPGLTFDRVTDGEKQVVAGVSYRLTLEASSSGAKDGRYEAVVYEQAGGSNSRKLVSFEPIH
ncbi:putative cysteine proteinase inhibitor 7 [Oryza brachyantha]|uniref:putative cysteine proteinase inhibitor 7 n=1 Tax=Oryza brachyantha TaxID=4533 RepID=UPI001ADB7BF6|nr:putative cysteine proteinase inhibitor 7 [Oryza brachyantha]